jgi:hypothetical protein
MGNQPVATENLGSPGKPGRRLTVRLFDRWALPSGLPDCFALPVVGGDGSQSGFLTGGLYQAVCRTVSPYPSWATSQCLIPKLPKSVTPVAVLHAFAGSLSHSMPESFVQN